MPTACLRSANACDPCSKARPASATTTTTGATRSSRSSSKSIQDRARQLGVTSEEVTQLLNTYFSGTAVSIYREGDNLIPIVLRAGAYTSQSLEGLTSATFAKNGGLISLAQVARLKPGFDFARIRRKNQERTITVTARSTSLTAGQLAGFDPARPAGAGPCRRLSSRYRRRDPEERGDQPETRAQDFRSRLAVMVLAIILQFNSFRRTLLTFMSIPLILIGIPFGLLATGQPLSFFGTLGIISLSGIIINNAIVLIDQIDIERKSCSCAKRSWPRRKSACVRSC